MCLGTPALTGYPILKETVECRMRLRVSEILVFMDDCVSVRTARDNDLGTSGDVFPFQQKIACTLVSGGQTVPA